MHESEQKSNARKCKTTRLDESYRLVTTVLTMHFIENTEKSNKPMFSTISNLGFECELRLIEMPDVDTHTL